MADLCIVPASYDGPIPDDFWDNYVDIDENGDYLGTWEDNYPEGGNGTADFVDYYEGNPDTELPKSHQHVGG